jgi:hypothetical protein
MAQGKDQIDGRQERSLLSLASWVDEPSPARGSLLDALARREAAKPAAQQSPLIAALAGSGRDDAPETRKPAGRTSGPTLFDMLRAGKKPKAVASPAAQQPAPVPAAPDIAVRPPFAGPRMAKTVTEVASPATGRLPRGAMLALPLAGALAGAGAGYLVAGPDMYAAKAELVLKPAQVRAAQGLPAEHPALPADAVTLAMAKVTAPDVLGMVVDRLSLATNPEFASGNREAAISALAGRLAVAQQQLTPGFTVTASSPSPQLAGDIANAVADSLAESHDANAAGPPPTELTVAFRAMPGTGEAVPQSWIKTAVGAGAGALAGLLLMPVAGAAWRRRGKRTSEKPRSATPAEPIAQRAATFPEAHGQAARPQIAARRASAWDRLRATGPARPAAASPAATMQLRPAPRPAAPAVTAATSRETSPQIPTPEQDAAMYQQQPHPYWQPAQPQPETAPYPQQAMHQPTQQPAWQQPPAAAYPQMPAPHSAMPAYAQPAAQQPMQHAPQSHGHWQAPAPMAPMPVYQQPQALAPAFQPPAPPPGYAPTQHFTPAQHAAMQHAAMNPAAYAGAAPMPGHYPHVVHHIHTMHQMPAQAAQGPTIDHREAVRPQPSRPVVVAAADAQSEEALSAIDELRAKLRAFAGTLDALRSARSA